MASRCRPLVALLFGGALLACGDDGGGPGAAPRSYFMGFSATPPRPDTAVLLPTLTLAAQHSDAGLIQLGIPWQVLLDGTSAAVEVRTVRLPLVNYYRGLGMKVVVALDVTDGLNRAAEAPGLVAANRSITDTAAQRLYHDYVAAVDSILHPDFLSLAAETNLIRLAAPAPLYAAVVGMVNDAAQERSASGSSTPLMVSVQVETAWGRLQGGTSYVGIAQDRADFPFLTALGLSSYPYLGGFADPDSVPLVPDPRFRPGRGTVPDHIHRPGHECHSTAGGLDLRVVRPPRSGGLGAAAQAGAGRLGQCPGAPLSSLTGSWRGRRGRRLRGRHQSLGRGSLGPSRDRPRIGRGVLLLPARGTEGCQKEERDEADEEHARKRGWIAFLDMKRLLWLELSSVRGAHRGGPLSFRFRGRWQGVSQAFPRAENSVDFMRRQHRPAIIREGRGGRIARGRCPRRVRVNEHQF